MIKYDRLWITVKKRGLSKTALHTKFGISKAQLYRLQHNEGVSSNTIDRLCNILDCDISDIMEHIPDDNRF